VLRYHPFMLVKNCRLTCKLPTQRVGPSGRELPLS
jgi:hypothetical protein